MTSRLHREDPRFDPWWDHVFKMEELVAPDDQRLLERLAKIRDSLKPSSTKALYCTFVRNLERCETFISNQVYRRQIGIKGYMNYYLTALAASHLFNTRPIEKKLEVFKDLKAELSGLLTGTLPASLRAHQGGQISTRARTGLIYRSADLLDEFPIMFL